MADARLKWFDEETDTPLIDTYVQQMDAFIAAMEDGVVDQSELDGQEARLIAVMKAVEPMLGDDIHPQITQLMLELACYGLMQTIRAIQEVQAATASP